MGGDRLMVPPLSMCSGTMGMSRGRLFTDVRCAGAQTRDGLRHSPLVRSVGMTTAQRTSTLAARLAVELRYAQDPIVENVVAQMVEKDRHYADTTRVQLDQIREACIDNVCAMVDALADPSTADHSAARAAGKLKAEFGIPISSLLHAYRLGGRSIWDALSARASGPADTELNELAADLWEVVDTFSDVAVESYHDTELSLTRADEQAHHRLVRSLFDDHSRTPGRVVEALRTLGLPESGTFLVVASDCPPVPHTAEQLTATLKAVGVQSVWDVQLDSVMGLLVAPTDTGLRQAFSALTEQLAGSVGISGTIASPAGIAAGLAQARVARRGAQGGLLHFGDDPIAHLLVAVPEASRVAAGQILGPILALPEAERADLLAALDVWYRSGGSAAVAAEMLYCHRNTVRYRLRKVYELTGRDTTDPAQSAELYLAMRSAQLI